MRTTLFAVLTMLLAVSALPFLSNDAVAVQARSSNTVLVEYAGNGETVEIVGEWDWSAPISMSENNGVWSADIALEEGLYCYKFIVDGTYVFDPANPERSYCGDYENSLLRVRNQSRPTYSAALNGDALHVKYHPGTSGAAHDGTPAALNGAIWVAEDSEWVYDLSELADGKHTLLIEART